MKLGAGGAELAADWAASETPTQRDGGRAKRFAVRTRFLNLRSSAGFEGGRAGLI